MFSCTVARLKRYHTWGAIDCPNNLDYTKVYSLGVHIAGLFL